MIEAAIYIAMFLVAILLVVRLWDKATMTKEREERQNWYDSLPDQPHKNDAKKTRQGRR